MKIWLICVVAAVLGIGGGVAKTLLIDCRASNEVFSPDQGTPDISENVEEPVIDGGPRLTVLNGETHNFGTMVRYSSRKHAFEIKNIGDEPLSMIIARTTCKCTFSKVSNNTIAPGDTGEVLLEWSAKGIGDTTRFSQLAEIDTNDPTRQMLELRIEGDVVDAVRVFPESLVIRSIPGNEASTADFNLISYGSEPLKVIEASILESDLAEKLELEFEPMPADKLKEYNGATDGMIGKLKIDAGLPLGPLIQTARLIVNQGEQHVIDMDVRGVVASDIVLSGGMRFDAKYSLLDIGNVPSRQGHVERMFIFVKGPHREETELMLGEISPSDYFEVSLSEPQLINNGKTTKYMLTIEIRKDRPPANHLGSSGTGVNKYGQILIESTHPQTKLVPLYVRFAVN